MSLLSHPFIKNMQHFVTYNVMLILGNSFNSCLLSFFMCNLKDFQLVENEDKLIIYRKLYMKSESTVSYLLIC